MTKLSHSAFRKYNKLNYQNNDRNMNRSYFNRNSPFFNTFNNAYQDYQNREDRRNEKSRLKIIIKVEKNLNERKFDKNNQKKAYNNSKNYGKIEFKSQNRYKVKIKNQNQINYKNKDKIKTFLSGKKNYFDLRKNYMKKYYQSENFVYFNSNNDFDNEKKTRYLNSFTYIHKNAMSSMLCVFSHQIIV